MCLILLAYQTHPDYKLIVAANRDEFYERPTAMANFWEDHPHILGGRDMVGKGTWMGINTRGMLSMITNYRDLSNIKPEAPSRGRLVSEFLIGEPPARDYLKQLSKVRDVYNGYNLILGNQDDLWYYSNVEGKVKRLGSGLYGLSNHLLNTPWPKVEKGISQFKTVIEDGDLEKLHDVLYNDEIAPDEKLPDTGIGLEKERMLSPLFIKSSNYGTRTSTVMKISNENDVEFIERTFDLTTYVFTDRKYNFKINGE